MHRFYGVMKIDDDYYKVMTLMREDINPKFGNGVHAYEVQEIEVSDELTPNTSNGMPRNIQSVAVANCNKRF